MCVLCGHPSQPGVIVLADVQEHATCVMGASGNSDDNTISSWPLSRYRDPKKVYDLSPTYCNCGRQRVNVLQVVEFLQSQERFLDRVLYHLGTSAIMDLLLRLVTSMEPMESRVSCVQVSCHGLSRCVDYLLETSRKHPESAKLS